jgi:hypothetical protein
LPRAEYGIGAALMNLIPGPSAHGRVAADLTTVRIGGHRRPQLNAPASRPATASGNPCASGKEAIEVQSSVPPEASGTGCSSHARTSWAGALLAGVKSGPDLPAIDDRVDAADRLTKRMRGMASRLVGDSPEVSAAVLVPFFVGVGLIAVTDCVAVIHGAVS